MAYLPRETENPGSRRSHNERKRLMLKRILIAILLLTSPTFAQQTGGQGGYTPLAYDSTLCSYPIFYEPPAGPVNCPAGESPDPGCIQDCVNTYQAIMYSAQAEACSAYNSRYQSYLDLIDFVTDGYTDCMAAAGMDLQAQQACNQSFQAATASIESSFLADVDGYSAWFEAEGVAAADGYWGCTVGCCEPETRYAPRDLALAGLDLRTVRRRS